MNVIIKDAKGGATVYNPDGTIRVYLPWLGLSELTHEKPPTSDYSQGPFQSSQESLLSFYVGWHYPDQSVLPELKRQPEEQLFCHHQ